MVINLNGLSSNKNLIISDKNTESGAIKSNNYFKILQKIKDKHRKIEASKEPKRNYVERKL